ncbi:hypothetical protein [Rhodopseudomonas sp.]|uniref:hypothetical protein n=1 Tax=Rhodopseudomonas sp. TaxID=1078 RepID=UPI0025D289F5|nr:hypothetical protein [Rhodopseudomonas sp.]
MDHTQVRSIGRISGQPIAVATAALIVIVLGIGGIVAWRSATGTVPEQERVTQGRMMQARVAQVSEQIVEKTKDLEASQLQSIDQLQVVQDQLQGIRQLLAEQRLESKRLSEQVGGLTESLDHLRQSFASVQPSEAAPSATVRSKPARHSRVHGRTKPRLDSAARKRGKSHS